MSITPDSERPDTSGPESAADSASRRRQLARHIQLDRSIEELPLFRLSDSSEEASLTYSPPSGGRWRVLPYPGDRLPGTFDQDVYVEIMRRYHDAGAPAAGAISFTLHSFLRSMGRRADGRTYEQLRGSLTRLERTVLESSSAYYDAISASRVESTFTLISSVAIERRRLSDLEQFTLFPALSAAEPGIARVVISPALRGNLSAGHSITLSAAQYAALQSPVARRLYRLLEAIRTSEVATWQVSVRDLAALLPLAQRYPSHLLRVLHPAHEMLISAGVLSAVSLNQEHGGPAVEYALGMPS